MHITGPHQCVDIGFMRLWRHGVAQKNNGIDFTRRQTGADLQIPAKRATEHALNLQAQFIRQALAGRTGCAQGALPEKWRELPGKFHHRGLLVVVCDQGNT